MNERQPQSGLFGDAEWWEEHWRGMPEFNQPDVSPRHTIEVQFKTRADAESFSRLIGQTITPTDKRTRSVWYPEAEIGRIAGRAWVDYSDERWQKKGPA